MPQSVALHFASVLFIVIFSGGVLLTQYFTGSFLCCLCQFCMPILFFSVLPEAFRVSLLHEAHTSVLLILAIFFILSILSWLIKTN